MSNGLIRGWDNFGNNNPHLGYLGTLTKTFEDKSSYATVFIWSQEPNQNNNNYPGSQPGWRRSTTLTRPRFIWTHAYTKPITEKLNYVFQFDYAQQTDAMSNRSGGRQRPLGALVWLEPVPLLQGQRLLDVGYPLRHLA